MSNNYNVFFKYGYIAFIQGILIPKSKHSTKIYILNLQIKTNSNKILNATRAIYTGITEIIGQRLKGGSISHLQQKIKYNVLYDWPMFSRLSINQIFLINYYFNL